MGFSSRGAEMAYAAMILDKHKRGIWVSDHDYYKYVAPTKRQSGSVVYNYGRTYTSAMR